MGHPPSLRRLARSPTLVYDEAARAADAAECVISCLFFFNTKKGCTDLQQKVGIGLILRDEP